LRNGNIGWTYEARLVEIGFDLHSLALHDFPEGSSVDDDADQTVSASPRSRPIISLSLVDCAKAMAPTNTTLDSSRPQRADATPRPQIRISCETSRSGVTGYVETADRRHRRTDERKVTRYITDLSTGNIQTTNVKLTSIERLVSTAVIASFSCRCRYHRIEQTRQQRVFYRRPCCLSVSLLVMCCCSLEARQLRRCACPINLIDVAR